MYKLLYILLDTSIYSTAMPWKHWLGLPSCFWTTDSVAPLNKQARQMLEAVAVFVRQSHSAVHMVDQPYRNEQILPLNFRLWSWCWWRREWRWLWRQLWRYRMKNMNVIVKVKVKVIVTLKGDCESDWDDQEGDIWIWLWKWGCI